MNSNTVTESAVRLPPGLWSHPLFLDGARFVDEPSPVMASAFDARIRRIRNMPSTSDDSCSAAVAGVDRVYDMARRWLDTMPCRGLDTCRELMHKIGRIRDGLAADLSEEMRIRMLAMLANRLPGELAPFVPSGAEAPDELRISLDVLGSMMLDHGLARNGAVGRRYRKRLYRAVDEALRFNATTDQVRVEPVLRWIRERFERERRTDRSYADVGCAIAQGAPATIAAARILRPGGLFGRIHGVDVVAPTRDFARTMLREHRVCLYGAEPCRRPLPRRYDAILLANVHRHLDRASQERLLAHLGVSLNDGGELFVNWRFEAGNSPCLSLKRVGDELRRAGERNLPT